MKRWYDDENECWMCSPDTCDEYLWELWAISYGYDGYETVEGLKSLIDELVEYALKARECLWEDKLFGAFGAPKNKTYRVPSREEWMEQYGTPKQIAGFKRRTSDES